MKSEEIREHTQKLHSFINSEFYYYQKTVFGRIATIIDATYSDPSQRQSQKDLVSEVIFNDRHFTKIVLDTMKDYAEAQGFELYQKDGVSEPISTNIFTLK